MSPSPSVSPIALAAEVADRIRSSRWSADSDGHGDTDWEALARRVFEMQRRRIEPLARWCARRGVPVAEEVPLWRLPAAPSIAWKAFDLSCAGTPARIFQTSGTSVGAARGRAAYSSAGLALMDAAIDVNAARMLFPSGRTSRILALAPSPETDPGRIMSYGLARLGSSFGSEPTRFFVGPSGLDLDAAIEALATSSADGTAVTLVGATFAMPPLLDRIADRHGRLPLPSGSAIMDAGGMKAHGATLEPAALRARVSDVLDVPSHACVNLLGMTELASQHYDDRLAAHAENRAPGRGKRPPPWCRVWAVDPETLEPLPNGVTGVLRHMDLANVERPAFVQTDDLGCTHADGTFEILGRAEASEARGCSLDAAEWAARVSA